ncbi:MAG: hypothetical protein M3R70_04300 [Actinomycetota bacterium]|nr:hypothetical protein [Actinomycetota bacterium]
MGWFRRRNETLNEKLAREAGLDTGADLEQPAPLEPEPRYPGPSWLGGPAMLKSAAITGLARAREWDAAVSVEAPELRGKQVAFVTLPDGSLIVEHEEGDARLDQLAAAVERELGPPYRAEGVRVGDTLWAVAAKRIEVAELEAQGEELELTKTDEGTTLTVDGERAFGSNAALEALGSRLGDHYAVRAQRLDGDLWEVKTSAL